MTDTGMEPSSHRHSWFFFSSRRRHTRLQGDWSSDVCSSDLSSLIGGVAVDAYDRRMILFASQIVPGIGSLAMLAAIATDHVSLELIYALVLEIGRASCRERV